MSGRRPRLGGNSLQSLFSDGFIRAFVTRNRNYDTSQWDPARWSSRLSGIGAMFQAFDPDLKRFAASGGKLILWNGTTDSSVSARDTARYYRRVVDALGRAKADRTVELFLAPGVGHCFGGPGPDQVDLLEALAAWDENSRPPSRQKLLLEKLDDTGAVVMRRPMCRYPTYPHYDGAGDPTDAESFACATPE